MLVQALKCLGTGNALKIYSINKKIKFTDIHLPRFVASPVRHISDETTYAWTQSDSDVTLFFSVPPNTAKPDIAYQLTNRTVELGIKNADILLQGALHAAVDVDGCTWTMSQEEQMNK